MTLKEYITKIVDKNLTYTDCDGCTRAVACLLELGDIRFKIWRGKCIAKNDSSKVISLHYWIEDSENEIWDFKCYKWIKRDSHECNYIKKEDVTNTFAHGIDLLRILIEFAPTIGKEQDELFEKITRQKLHRKSR